MHHQTSTFTHKKRTSIRMSFFDGAEGGQNNLLNFFVFFMPQSALSKLPLSKFPHQLIFTHKKRTFPRPSFLNAAQGGQNNLLNFFCLFYASNQHYPNCRYPNFHINLFLRTKKGHSQECPFSMVPKVGLEPTPCCQDRILSPARLPIPPLRRMLR